MGAPGDLPFLRITVRTIYCAVVGIQGLFLRAPWHNLHLTAPFLEQFVCAHHSATCFSTQFLSICLVWAVLVSVRVEQRVLLHGFALPLQAWIFYFLCLAAHLYCFACTNLVRLVYTYCAWQHI